MTNVKTFILTLLVVSDAVILRSEKNENGNANENMLNLLKDESNIFALANFTVKTIIKSWDLAFRLSSNEDYLSWAAWELSKKGFPSLLNISDQDINGTIAKDLENLTKWKDELRNSFKPELQANGNNYNFTLCITGPLKKKLCTEITTHSNNKTLNVTTKIDNNVQTSQNIDVFNPLAFCLIDPNVTENRYCLMTYNINYTDTDINGCLRVDYHVWYERFDFPTVCIKKTNGNYSYDQKNMTEKQRKSRFFHESPLPTVRRQA